LQVVILSFIDTSIHLSKYISAIIFSRLRSRDQGSFAQRVNGESTPEDYDNKRFAYRSFWEKHHLTYRVSSRLLIFPRDRAEFPGGKSRTTNKRAREGHVLSTSGTAYLTHRKDSRPSSRGSLAVCRPREPAFTRSIVFARTFSSACTDANYVLQRLRRMSGVVCFKYGFIWIH